MKTPVRIGTYTLTEDTKFHNANYATAAWWTDVMVPAGEYAVMAEVDEDGKVEDDTVNVALDGTCVDAYFGTLLCGVPINGEAHKDRNVGRPETYYLHPYAHALANALLNKPEDVDRYTLDANFVAVPVPFVGTHGVPSTTYAIRTLDYRERDERLLTRYASAMYDLGVIDTEKYLATPLPAHVTGGGYRGDGTGEHPGIPYEERRLNVLKYIEGLKKEVAARFGLTFTYR